MEYRNNLSKNIFKNYVFILLNEFDLTHGIWMIYLASKGVSLTELGILEGIFHITSFFMEIPTGAIADIWGRKVSRVCGRVCKLISAIILLYSNNYVAFIIGFIVSALSYNLESGAGEALVYDSLKELGEEKKYMKICGINEIIMQIAQTFGMLLGGFLSNYSYTYAYILTIGVSILTIIQALYFKEPNIKMEFQEKNFKLLKNQVVESFKIIVNNKKIGFLIIFSQALFMFGTSIYFYFQNYLLSNGVSKGNIGIILSLSSFAGAITASQAYKIEKKVGDRGIIMFLPIITALCIWGVALSKYYFIFFILINGVESIVFVAVGDYINRLLPSDKRATILSMASMIFSLYMIIVFPIIGKLGDMYSLKFSFEILALSATLMCIINIIIFKLGNANSKK